MNSAIRWFYIVMLLAGATACDPAYPLFLQNGLPSPITIQTTYTEGDPTEGILQPGDRLTFLHPKGEIERVIVLHEGKKLHDLDRQELAKMRDSVPKPRQVTWDIRADEVKQLTGNGADNK